MARPKPATEVDHIVPVAEGGTDDPSNLQAINKVCHKRKTKLDEGARPSYGADESGLPLDPRHPWRIQEREALERATQKQKTKGIDNSTIDRRK